MGIYLLVMSKLNQFSSVYVRIRIFFGKEIRVRFREVSASVITDHRITKTNISMANRK